MKKFQSWGCNQLLCSYGPVYGIHVQLTPIHYLIKQSSSIFACPSHQLLYATGMKVQIRRHIVHLACKATELKLYVCQERCDITWTFPSIKQNIGVHCKMYFDSNKHTTLYFLTSLVLFWTTCAWLHSKIKHFNQIPVQVLNTDDFRLACICYVGQKFHRFKTETLKQFAR